MELMPEGLSMTTTPAGSGFEAESRLRSRAARRDPSDPTADGDFESSCLCSSAPGIDVRYRLPNSGHRSVANADRPRHLRGRCRFDLA
jgi:hypothetical protein